MTKVHIALGNDLLNRGMNTILSELENVKVTGVSSAYVDVQLALVVGEIDVLFIDYGSPGISFDHLHHWLKTHPGLIIIGITANGDVTFIKRLMRSGIAGHLLHDCDAEEIRQSVEECANGNKFFCGKILDLINESEDGTESSGCDPVVISEREIQIINLIAQGLTTKEIALRLHISAHTVMTHRKNIMGKLNLNNAAGLISYAVKENLISPNKFLFS